MKIPTNFGIRSLIAILTALMVIATALAADGGGLWPFAGHDLSNTRQAETEVGISPANVEGLIPKWVVTTGGDVSATPAVDDKHVYVPDWAGNLFKLDRRTGEVVWSRQISEYTGIIGDFALTTPAIHGDKLILGNQGGRLFEGAIMLAVSKETGDLIWSTPLDVHPAALVTQSAVVKDNQVFVGVSSMEELFAAVIPNYRCCTFRGSVVSLDVDTGQILWKTLTAPEGYSGNGVWGSTPVVDSKRGSLYVTTENNYSVPEDVLECVAAAGDDPDAAAGCVAPDNFFDSILALDLDTGQIKWNVRTLPFDAWTMACLVDSQSDNCPSPAGRGWDFGQGPALFTTHVDKGNPRELLGAGQNSGQYWVVDPETGQIVWVTRVGPGSPLGGLVWGSAVDGEHIYVANANADRINWTLTGGTTINYGFWSALDAATGEILWQTPNPSKNVNQGAVTVANGVVFGCSLDAQGHMYAMDAATGEIMWSFASGGSCNGGAAVVDGTVYWGSGYADLANFLHTTGNDKLYAFEVKE